MEHESVPDLWFRANYEKYYEENLKVAADFLGAEPENVAFAANTTTGMCAISCILYVALTHTHTHSHTHIHIWE